LYELSPQSRALGHPACFWKPFDKTAMTIRNDDYWMRHALVLARRAQAEGEVPVGAVIVSNEEIVAEGWNQPIATSDPTAHAEIVALRAAAGAVANYRLPSGMTLYVTLEPCPMCAGAMVHARVSRVVFGTADPRTGAAGTVFNLLDSEQLNHQAQVSGGVLEDECSQLITGFFRDKR
jgi:tRNA(adenine34) deaminase